MNIRGKVYLVGAGCGDYDLITLRGINLIKRCDVLIYDALTDNRLLDFAPDGSEKICAGKRCGLHSEPQENINRLLIQKAEQGKTVVRLKGGDPFVFGRGGEEILALQKAGVEYAVVPGISSATAVPELAGIPVTHRKISRAFHVIAGHTTRDLTQENIAGLAKLEGTLVFLMGLNNIAPITEALIKGGMNENTPAAVVSNGATAGQKVLRSALKDIAAEASRRALKPPAVIIVGETAGFDFSQTISLPLKNTSVTVTGTEKFAGKLSLKLSSLGADVKTLDYLKAVEYRENPEFDSALLNISDYGLIVLTSVNGVQIFFNRLNKLKIDIRDLCKIKFAVIGSSTAWELEKRGIFADIIPQSFTSKALGKALAASPLAERRVLILRSEQASEALNEELDAENIKYDDIKIYDVLGSAAAENAAVIDSDFLTFASASAVKVFFESGFALSEKTKTVCIGDVTAKAAEKYGVNNLIISRVSNAENVTDTILCEVQQNEKIQTTQN